MNTTPGQRKNALVKAAKIRAQIMRIVGETAGPHTLATLLNACNTEETPCTRYEIDRILRHMSLNKQLYKHMRLHRDENRCLSEYSLPPERALQLTKHQHKTAALATTPIDITVVKATGRVQIVVSGICIEIGVS